MVYYTKPGRFVSNKHFSLVGSFVSCKENEVLWIKSQEARYCIRNTIFSQLAIGPNKLEWYITLSQEALPVTNTPAY